MIEATAKQIIAINQEMLQEEAAFAEVTAETKKRLADINTNRLAAESDFTEVFTKLDAQRTVAREKVLDNRFRMRELMSAEEWRNVYAAVSQQD